MNGTLRQGSVSITGGTLLGTGLIEAPVTIGAGGIVNPGNSPGILEIEHDFRLDDGSLVIEIIGTDAGEFDVLRVGSKALFTGGTLVFDFLNATDLAGDMSFHFLESPTISGLNSVELEFLGLAPGFSYSLLDNGTISLAGVQLASPVPLPGALPLLFGGLGILRLAGRRSRRR
ncbi:MAG: hypothetical protein H6978_06355 [Gammaproteobacteria bacterium]|nr:hypothetical protein [Gammaproteobacteria bacterium]